MPQHSFLTRKDGDLLALLAILLLYPKTPVQKGTYIPRSPDLRRAFSKALPRQALHTQEMTWYRGERFCSKWVSSMCRPSVNDREALVAVL